MDLQWHGATRVADDGCVEGDAVDAFDPRAEEVEGWFPTPLSFSLPHVSQPDNLMLMRCSAEPFTVKLGDTVYLSNNARGKACEIFIVEKLYQNPEAGSQELYG